MLSRRDRPTTISVVGGENRLRRRKWSLPLHKISNDLCSRAMSCCKQPARSFRINLCPSLWKIATDSLATFFSSRPRADPVRYRCKSQCFCCSASLLLISKNTRHDTILIMLLDPLEIAVAINPTIGWTGLGESIKKLAFQVGAPLMAMAKLKQESDDDHFSRAKIVYFLCAVSRSILNRR